MKKWLQRIRGAVGTAVTWAAAWGVVGVMLRIVLGVITGGPIAAASGSLVAGLVPPFVLFGMFGFVGGAAFSGVLGIAEGRRRFDQMSLPRFAGWGAVGGLLLAALMFAVGWGFTLGDLIIVGIMPLLGAGSAAGSLALARRAGDRELLEAGEEALGLTEG